MQLKLHPQQSHPALGKAQDAGNHRSSSLFGERCDIPQEPGRCRRAVSDSDRSRGRQAQGRWLGASPIILVGDDGNFGGLGHEERPRLALRLEELRLPAPSRLPLGPTAYITNYDYYTE